MSTATAADETAQRQAIIGILGRGIAAIQEASKIPTFESQQQLILLGLYIRGAIQQEQLSDISGVGKSSNSRNIERLGPGRWLKDRESKAGLKKFFKGLGWLQSDRYPQNQRIKIVSLTSEGLGVLDDIADAIRKDFLITTRTTTNDRQDTA